MGEIEIQPLVSVCIITYNHEKFIRNAIEGVLNQKIDFSWEVIIADDCSTDGTTEILKQYASQHPDLIQLILQAENKGPGKNWHDLISAARGKYIAYFEGDDYWIDNFKLQKQIDFLEANPEYSLCFHNCKIISEEDQKEIGFSNPANQPDTSSFEDLAKGEFIFTVTNVFRNKDFKKFPERYMTYMNNYTLDLHNAQYGKIKYLNEVMAVYRKHKQGVWSMVPREKTLVTHMPAYEFYPGYFNKKYKKYFLVHLKNMTLELIMIKLQNKDFKHFSTNYLRFLRYNISDIRNLKTIMYVTIKAFEYRIKQLISK